MRFLPSLALMSTIEGQKLTWTKSRTVWSCNRWVAPSFQTTLQPSASKLSSSFFSQVTQPNSIPAVKMDCLNTHNLKSVHYAPLLPPSCCKTHNPHHLSLVLLVLRSVLFKFAHKSLLPKQCGGVEWIWNLCWIDLRHRRWQSTAEPGSAQETPFRESKITWRWQSWRKSPYLPESSLGVESLCWRSNGGSRSVAYS